MGIYNDLRKQGFFPVYDEYPPSEKGCCRWATLEESEGFKYLFNKYQSTLNEFKDVPPQLIHNLVKQLTLPFMAEYVEVTDAKEFLEISSEFFCYMFWGQRVYVSFEDFNQIVDDCLNDIEQNPIVENDVPEGKTFHLWFKNTSAKEEEITFTHAKTGLVFERPNWREIFVSCTWDGLNFNSRFCDWYSLGYRMILEGEMIKMLAALTSKKMELYSLDEEKPDTRKPLQARRLTRNNFLDSIYAVSPFIPFSFDAAILEKQFITATEFKDFQTAIHLGWDRALAELGRVANTNPKMERLTTGENYKDIVAVANRQRLTLNQLKLFGIKAKEKWGIELKFALNGIPQRKDPETDIETSGMETNANAVDGMGSLR